MLFMLVVGATVQVVIIIIVKWSGLSCLGGRGDEGQNRFFLTAINSNLTVTPANQINVDWSRIAKKLRLTNQRTSRKYVLRFLDSPLAAHSAFSYLSNGQYARWNCIRSVLHFDGHLTTAWLLVGVTAWNLAPLRLTS